MPRFENGHIFTTSTFTLRLISFKRLKVAPFSDKISEHAQYQLLYKTTCFYFRRATEKNVQLAWTFFQVAGE